MSVVVVTPPASPLIDLDLVKKHLRVETDDDDALIDLYLQAAVSHLDGPGGWLGRALGEQTLEFRTHCFPYGGLALPFPPLIELMSVVYLNSDGVETTGYVESYTLAGGHLRPVYGATWPSTRLEADAVRITYKAGYPADQLPGAIQAALLLMVGDLYDNRSSVTDGPIASVPMSTTVESLLGPYRVWSI